MRRLIGIICFCLLCMCELSSAVISRIVIEGMRKVSRETVLFYMRSREGGEYSEERLREDFRSLWETGFFKDILIESEDSSSGKVVYVRLVEHKLISLITYETGKKVKESDIVEKLQENSLVLLAFSHYNPVKMKRIEGIIKEMLVEKGFSEGRVEIESKLVGDQVSLLIKVFEGPKTRIGAIVFPGAEGELSFGFLSGGMSENKIHGLLSALGGKDVYNREKMEEDLEGVRLRLQERGYLESKLGTPRFVSYRGENIFGSERKFLRIEIPVDLGPRYRLGEVNVEGNKILRSEFLLSFIKMERGSIYNIKKRNKSIEEMLKFYRTLGYFYGQIVPVENLDPVKKVADLTLRVLENDVCYLGKLEFVGNTFTKDHVIRREWLLREGMRLNVNALESSIRRMKQLGLVTVEKMPDIRPDADEPTKIHIRCEVKELNRQMINFSSGYSGYDGWFIALGYQTQNFLGLGETFAINFQSGTRSKNYRFAFTEPYLFNLPASLGIDVHKTSFKYPGLYTRDGEGFTVSTSFRLWRFWGTSLFYSFENVEIGDVNESISWTNPYSLYYYTPGKRKISSLSPTVYYSTVDSPIFPRSGTKYLFNYRYSGGFLGGDIDLHKVKAEFVKFVPIFRRRHVLGFHVVYQGMFPFGNNYIPFYERYFLGGERSIRGFDIYQIGPRDESGYVIGGDKALFFNFEYQIPLSQQFSFAFFFDMGNAYDIDKPINFRDVYTSMGAEVKVYVQMLGVPFRLIFAYNPRVHREAENNFAFRFAVGPSFY